MSENILITFIILIHIKTISSDVNCTLYRDNLANALSAFVSCSITHSRPIKFCESCVNNFIDIKDSYNNLTKFRDDKDLCINNYIHMDRLEILLSLYDNSNNLWERAKCNECFDKVNGTLTNKTSVEMNKFNELYEKLNTCLKSNNLNITTFCKTCLTDYTILNDYYIDISNENEKIDICMDIVDVMNTTRAFWSSNCCRFRHKNEAGFIVSTIVVIILVPLFYILTKVCSEKKIPVILQQSRLAGSFNQAHS